MLRPLFTLSVIALVNLLSSAAEAAPRVRPGRAVAAMRQQEINRLQKQLETAQAALSQLQSTASQDSAEILSARDRAVAARDAINEMTAAHREFHQQLNELEDTILEEQSADSDWSRATESLDAARRSLDTEMHRIMRWNVPAPDEPEATRLKELATLSTEQRSSLRKDPAYAERLTAVNAASDALNRTRRQLLEANEQWKALDEEHRRFTQELSEAERRRSGAANDRLNAQKDLRTKEQIAASLIQSIGALEAKLRSLGAAPRPAARSN